jgi:hypothetical protein
MRQIFTGIKDQRFHQLTPLGIFPGGRTARFPRGENQKMSYKPTSKQFETIFTDRLEVAYLGWNTLLTI